MAGFCVILSGRLPGDKDDASVWAPIRAAFKLDDATFAQRILAALPLTVKRNLDQAAANHLVQQMRAQGVNALVALDDVEVAHFEHNGTNRGPIPRSALKQFIKPLERYRLRDEQEWQIWDDSVAVSDFLLPAQTSNLSDQGEEELPPPLPHDEEPPPPPFLTGVSAPAIGPNNSIASKQIADEEAPPPLPAQDEPPPPPFLKPSPSVKAALPNSRESSIDRSRANPQPALSGDHSPSSYKRSKPAISSRSNAGLWALVALIILVGAGSFAWFHFNSEPAQLTSVTPPVVTQQPVPIASAALTTPQASAAPQPSPATQGPTSNDVPPASPSAAASTSRPADIGAGADLSFGSRPAPVYPAQAVRQHHTGTVTLLILVGIDGVPKNIKVETSSGFQELDKAATDAVQSWQFNPEVKDGSRVEGYARVPVSFNLATADSSGIAETLPTAGESPKPAADAVSATDDCSGEAPKPQSPEEVTLLANSQRHLTGHSIRAGAGGNIYIVEAALGYDGQCRASPYQIYVFNNNKIVGTLSPQAMTARADGAIADFKLVDPEHLQLDIERYKPNDPACCASSHEQRIVDLRQFGEAQPLSAPTSPSASRFQASNVSSDAGTASFDCTKANAPTDVAICGSRMLSSLDVVTANMYRKAMALDTTDKVLLRDDQRQWLRNRALCGADETCIEKQSTDRIAIFQQHYQVQ